MDFTQPDIGQPRPDDASGDDIGTTTPNDATGHTAESFAQPLPGPEPDAERPQRFADVLAEVDAVDERPLAEHNDVFTQAHRELTDALNDVERGDS